MVSVTTVRKLLADSLATPPEPRFSTSVAVTADRLAVAFLVASGWTTSFAVGTKQTSRHVVTVAGEATTATTTKMLASAVAEPGAAAFAAVTTASVRAMARASPTAVVAAAVWRCTTPGAGEPFATTTSTTATRRLRAVSSAIVADIRSSTLVAAIASGTTRARSGLTTCVALDGKTTSERVATTAGAATTAITTKMSVSVVQTVCAGEPRSDACATAPALQTVGAAAAVSRCTTPDTGVPCATTASRTPTLPSPVASLDTPAGPMCSTLVDATASATTRAASGSTTCAAQGGRATSGRAATRVGVATTAVTPRMWACAAPTRDASTAVTLAETSASPTAGEGTAASRSGTPISGVPSATTGSPTPMPALPAVSWATVQVINSSTSADATAFAPILAASGLTTFVAEEESAPSVPAAIFRGAGTTATTTRMLVCAA
mmetsp:Transcript_48720/g.114373  ORF Transcript_48720/g.114373 Transcript_48720/m.114373 type:complete len:436 (+) Transcript_48720:865-2172(+)